MGRRGDHVLAVLDDGRVEGRLYNTLGHPRTQSIWLGLGVTLLGGVMNEFGDGFNRYGVAYQDLTMDAAGAISAALVSSPGATT